MGGAEVGKGTSVRRLRARLDPGVRSQNWVGQAAGGLGRDSGGGRKKEGVMFRSWNQNICINSVTLQKTPVNTPAGLGPLPYWHD